MFFALFFVLFRIFEFIFLLPIVGMLGFFVNIYLESNVMTPSYILVLFIVSVLAVVWAIGTLFSYHRSSHNAQFVAIVDLAFVGALIAGVWYLRFIARADCVSVQPGSSLDLDLGIIGSASIRTFDVNVNKSCAMLKASFSIGIISTILFFFSALACILHSDHAAKHERRRHHSRHRSHRSHSHSRAYV